MVLVGDDAEDVGPMYGTVRNWVRGAAHWVRGAVKTVTAWAGWGEKKTKTEEEKSTASGSPAVAAVRRFTQKGQGLEPERDAMVLASLGALRTEGVRGWVFTMSSYWAGPSRYVWLLRGLR
eukprot:392897-Rhodomonas_salina.3